MGEVIIKNYKREKTIFFFKNMERSFINTLRRILISNLPSYTIDIIEIYKNNSFMNDEYLAHRIGLVPFSFLENENEFRNREDCFCYSGCPKCSIYFKLEKENFKNELMNVYSSDFQQENNENYKIEPISIQNFPKGILLCKLDHGESISLRGLIRKGTGGEHAKWSSVSTVSFREIPFIKLKKDEFNQEEREKIISSCPVNVFQEKGKKLILQQESDCIQCNLCSDINPSIEISYHPNDFELTIEGNGIIDTKVLLKMSLSFLKEKMKDLKRLIEKS